MAKNKRPRTKSPGPAPGTQKNQGGWKAAAKKANQQGRPNAGRSNSMPRIRKPQKG